ncbi:MAG: hypothetical protein K0S30_2516, partial [Clostridia bacterium]|jgi:hypothetical protein|nr:hypothetical protein [Clostridia bacterium]
LTMATKNVIVHCKIKLNKILIQRGGGTGPYETRQPSSS